MLFHVGGGVFVLPCPLLFFFFLLVEPPQYNLAIWHLSFVSPHLSLLLCLSTRLQRCTCLILCNFWVLDCCWCICYFFSIPTLLSKCVFSFHPYTEIGLCCVCSCQHTSLSLLVVGSYMHTCPSELFSSCAINSLNGGVCIFKDLPSLRYLTRTFSHLLVWVCICCPT